MIQIEALQKAISDLQNTRRIKVMMKMDTTSTDIALEAMNESLQRQAGCERCMCFPIDDGTNDDNLFCFSCGRQIVKKRLTLHPATLEKH